LVLAATVRLAGELDGRGVRVRQLPGSDRVIDEGIG
jgi:hypothetical protein